MEPSSSLPNAPAPRGKRLLPRQILPAVGVVVLVVLFAVLFQALRGGTGSTSTTNVAQGPYATPTSAEQTATANTTPTSNATPAPGHTPTPGGAQTGSVRVTQNQDEVQSCMDNPSKYTVTLLNAGTVTAHWLRYLQNDFNPWAQILPESGSIAPGQTASFTVTPRFAMPCDGMAPYKAWVKLTFPDGITQPDLQLTYTGTGPSPASDVELLSGTLNMTQPCPASGAAPAPYTFVLKNEGNGMAYITLDDLKDTIGPNPWASESVVRNPVGDVQGVWMYPGQTWTVTVSPHAGPVCDGATIYHTYVGIKNTHGATDIQSTLTFTVVFQKP